MEDKLQVLQQEEQQVNTSKQMTSDDLYSIINTVLPKVNWYHRKFDAKRLLEKLKKVAKRKGFTLYDMEKTSLELAKSYAEMQQTKKKFTELNVNGRCKSYTGGLPFYIKTFKKKEENSLQFTDCFFSYNQTYFPKVIPREYMDILKYFGLLCIYTTADFEHIIPMFPNNVVHISFDSDTNIYYDYKPGIIFPPYLIKFEDNFTYFSSFEITENEEIDYPPQKKLCNFLSSLPSTVRFIKTEIIYSENLPPNLDTAIFRHGIPDLLYMPNNMSSITIYTYMTNPIINFPLGTEFASIKLGHFQGGSDVVISNTRILKITNFIWFVEYCCKCLEFSSVDINPSKENLVLIESGIYNSSADCPGSKYEKYYQNINIFIGNNVEILILDIRFGIHRTLEILDAIKTVSPSFRQLSIITSSIKQAPWKKIRAYLKDNLSSFTDSVLQKIILQIMHFEQRFPHVTIKIYNNHAL